ncbi:hypothetical protein Tco_1185310 [Tanacetum coccineum]
MLTSNTHQESLVDAGSETRPLMLERGSYIPWASRFRRYLTRKIENIKWLNKAIDEGLYEFKDSTPSSSEPPRPQTEDDLTGDDLKHYEAEIEAMNLILISIPNDIYNYVDAYITEQAMWQRVERLMQGTVQNKVDSETRFNNEFDQFVAEQGEALVLFLNCLQPEWLKYVTQVRLEKMLTEDSYDDLFHYLSQYDKLVNASGAKKLKKSHDPLALVAHKSSSSRNPSPYYVTHPSLVVDYDDDYQGDTFQNNSEDPLISEMMLLARAITQRFSNPTNNRLRTSSNTRNQEIIEGNIVQNDAGNIQRTLRTTSSGYAANMLLAKQDEAGVTLIDEQNDFLVADTTRMEEIKELSANICLMAIIQPSNINSDVGPSYDSACLNVNSGSVEYDNNVQASYELEQLGRNAYKEAEKQQINANKAERKAKRLEKDLQTQFIRDRDIIQDLEQQQDKL